MIVDCKAHNKEINSYDELEGRMYTCGACPQAFQALKEARQRYKKETKA